MSVLSDNYLALILVRPVIEITLLGILAGLVGTIALLTKHIFFSESITHSTFPGAVLGVVIGGANSWTIYGGAIAMCIPFSWLMHRLARVRVLSTQAAAAIVLTFAFALGYFLNKWFAPLPVKVDSFLSGSLLTVNNNDLIAAACVLILVVAVFYLAGLRLIAFAFEPAQAPYMRVVVLVMIVLSIVVMIPAVGTILSLALLVVPAAIASLMSTDYRRILIISPIIGIFIGYVGLAISIVYDLSSGGSITVFAGCMYVCARIVKKIIMRWNTH